MEKGSLLKCTSQAGKLMEKGSLAEVQREGCGEGMYPLQINWYSLK